MMRFLAHFLFPLLLMVLVGCSNVTPSASSPLVTTQPVSPPLTPETQRLSGLERIKFKTGDKDAFTLKFKADGAKLVNPLDQEMARLTADPTGKIKIKDSIDRTLGFVVPETNVWKLKTANQKQVLYVLRRQRDGDYKLEDGTNQSVYLIKKRDYGYEIKTSAQQSLYQIKGKDGKMSLRNSSDQIVLSTRSPFSAIGMACFGLDVLTPEQKAAMAYAMTQAGE